MAKAKSSIEKPILFGFATREHGPSGRWRIRFRWGRIAALFCALSVAAYLAMCGLFYAIFKYSKGYDEVTYGSMLTYLFNQEEHRVKRGDFHLEVAKTAIENGEFNEAYGHLVTGVSLSPANLEGRLMLSEFQLLTRQEDRALRTLREGIPYASNDVAYLERYIQVMLRNQKDYEVIEVAQSILRANPDQEVKQLLSLGAAQAHFFRGNYDEAEDYLNEGDLLGQIPGAILQARINWLRGQRSLALEQLLAGADNFPQKDPFYALLTEYYRELGDLSRAKQYAVLRSNNAPLSIAPRIGLLNVYDASGDKERARNEARAILRQFSQDEQGLLQLGNYATEVAEIELMRRIYQTALENGFNVAPFALLVIECQIAAEEYEEAVVFSEDLATESPEWLESTRAVFNSLRAVAYYGMGNAELCQLYLEQFLQAPVNRPDVHLAVSRRFEKMGAALQARNVLETAFRSNPDNQNALTRLIALELELGNSSEVGPYLKKLLKMRRPSRDVLREAYRRLGSDRFIFTPDRDSILIELRSMLNEERPA